MSLNVLDDGKNGQPTGASHHPQKLAHALPVRIEKCIVIIEGSRSSLTQLEKFVASPNLKRCVTFDDPIRASTVLAHLNPGLVLVVYEMPGMDGVAFVGWMRGDPTIINTPVIIITGHSDRDILRAALEAGANDFIRKPVDQFELRPRIQNLLKLNEAQSKLCRRADWFASEVVTAGEVIRKTEHEIIFAWHGRSNFVTPKPGGHIRRIATYSAFMGRELGLDADCDPRTRGASA